MWIRRGEGETGIRNQTVILQLGATGNEDCGTCNLSGCDRRHLAFGGGSRLTVEQATGVRCQDAGNRNHETGSA